jgi:hypothetical protein
MPRAHAHHPLRATGAARLALVAVVACCCGLLLPAAASGKVDKLFASKYKAQVDLLVMQRSGPAGVYDDETRQYEEIYAKIAQYLASNDPNDLQKLVDWEAVAAVHVTAYRDSYKGMMTRLLKQAKAVYANTRHYFSNDADLPRLKSGCDDWEDGMRAAGWAFRDMAGGFEELSNGNVDEAAAWASQANEKSAAAGDDQTLGLKKLKALER